MKSLSAKTFQCGVTVQGLTTLSGTVYLTALTNTATWDYVVVGTTAQGQLYTRTYAQLMSDITSGIGLSGYVPTSRTLTINGVSYDLTANRSWTISTVDYTSRLQHQVKAGVAINKGQAVYVTSADGTNMIVGLASNASEATSSKTMGLLDATVSTNGFANVVTEGLLAGLDTSTAGTEGDPVWLGTGGNLIYGLINKPYAPAHLVFIGIVTRKNSNNGEIFVKVQNGFELNEIHDVDLKTNLPVNGELLGFNGTLWVNKTIAGWLGYTPANASGTTNYISKFTGSTTLGNSLVFDNGTNVGIGTVTPDSRLHIEGNTTGSGSGADAIVHIKQNGGWNGNEPWALYVEGYSYLNGFRVNAYDTQRGLYSDAGELGFAVGGNSPISFTQNTSDYRMYIAPGGNIGIGTTSPSTKLHVSTTGNTDGLVQLLNGDSNYGATTRYSRGGNYNWDIGVGAGASNNIPFSYFGIADGGVTPRLVIAHTSGSVGIGTTSPNSSAKLHLSGATTSPSLNTTNPANITAIFSNSDPQYGTMFATDPTGKGLIQQRRTDSATYYDLLLQPYGGNIGIGTASPTTALHVVGTVTATAIQLNTGSGDYYINGSSNTLRIGSLTAANKIQLELFHAANPVSLGIAYNGGQALPYIESVHPSYDVNTHLLFKPGGGETWRIGSHGSSHVYASAFAIKPAYNDYDFYLANSSGTALFYSDTSTGNIGIGTTAPASRLHISGSTDATQRIIVNGSGNNSSLHFNYNGSNVGFINSYQNSELNIGTSVSAFVNFYTNNTERIRIAASGNVGIGTTNPVYTLDVNGSFNALTSGVYLTYNSGIIYHGSSYYQFPSGSYYLLYGRTGMGLIFGSNNAEVGRFDLSGNLGIGTTAPAEKLHVTQNIALGLTGGSIGDTNNILFPTVNGGTHAGVPNGIYYTKKGNWGGQIDIRTSYDWGYSTDNAKISLNGAEGNGITFSTGASALGSTERVRITSDGNVGIGTSTPVAALHTFGTGIINIVQSSNDVSYTQYYNTSTNAGGTNDGLTVGNNGLTAYIWQRESADLLLGTSNTEAIRITSTQNVGIGTTSPSAKLDVNGAQIIQSAAGFGTDGDQAALFLSNTANFGLSGNFSGYSRNLIKSDGGSILTVGRWNTSLISELSIESGSSGLIKFLAGASERMRITSAGNVVINSTSTPYVDDKLYIASGNIILDNNRGYLQYTTGGARATLLALNSSNTLTVGQSNAYNASLLLYGGTGNVTVNAGTIEVARFTTAGNVGIGTTSPAYKLDIGSNTSETVRISAVATNGSTGTLLFGSNAIVSQAAKIQGIYGGSYDGTLVFYTQTAGATDADRMTEKVRILSNGNVGIGTGSPGFKLDVNGTARVNQGGVNGSGQALIVAGSGDVQLTDGGSLFFGSYDYGGSTYIRAFDDGNIMYFYLNGTNMAYFRNDRAYFNANVGIGTSSPTQILHVAGNIRVTGAFYDSNNQAGTSGQILKSTGSGTDWVSLSEITGVDGTGTANYVTKWSDADTITNSLIYDNGTNVGIGTTSPGYNFDVNGQVRVQDKLRVGTVNSGNGVVHMSSSATINPNTTTIVWAQNVSVGMCAFIEYYILNNNTTTDQRAGTIMVTWNQSGTPTIAHTETTTPDIGSTTPVIFTSSLVGSDARINAVNASSAPYTIVMNYRYF